MGSLKIKAAMVIFQKKHYNQITISATNIHHEQHGGYDEARVGGVAEERSHEGW